MMAREIHDAFMFHDSFGIKPAYVSSSEDFAAWFAALADSLLNAAELAAGGAVYRLAEVEFYYHAPAHPEPFAHLDPIQLNYGPWYFHRTHEAYRGGSYKGLDLALGDGTAYFGILIRSIFGPGGEIVDGPSLTVDRLLTRTGVRDVPTLARLIGGRQAWDASSPLVLRPSEQARAATIYACPRVGLSLRRAASRTEMFRFIGLPYRFLTEPRAIAKGKPQLVLSLHRRGLSPEAIRAITGCPTKAIERYIREFVAGREMAMEKYAGKSLSTSEICRLLGAWDAAYGR